MTAIVFLIGVKYETRNDVVLFIDRDKRNDEEFKELEFCFSLLLHDKSTTENAFLIYLS